MIGQPAMIQIAEPIIGIELDSKVVNVFWTLAEAETYIEVVDKKNWLIFDSVGRELRITPKHQGYRVSLVATQKNDKSTLLLFLESYLRQPNLANDTPVTYLRKLASELQNLTRFPEL